MMRCFFFYKQRRKNLFLIIAVTTASAAITIPFRFPGAFTSLRTANAFNTTFLSFNKVAYCQTNYNKYNTDNNIIRHTYFLSKSNPLIPIL